MRKFWLVLRDKQGSQAGHRHESLEAAVAEAKRLQETIQDSFYVLETVGIMIRPANPSEYIPVGDWDE